MKKTVLLMGFIVLSAMLYAEIDRPVTVAELPQKAQDFIRSNFPDKEVSYAKIDGGYIGGSYDLVFVDGTKVEFTRSGDWKEIKCRYSKVPDHLIPQKIRDYVQKNFPNQPVVKIERKKRKYEVELRNDLDLEFDLKGNFLRLDD